MTYLRSRTDHPSAEQIYENVRLTMPKISLGTVYRNLALLNDMGEVRIIYAGTGADHFDANVAVHDHFICRNCHAIQDLPDGQRPVPDLPDFTGVVEDSCTYFYGICGKCKSILADEASADK
jgi:Fur family peroxide stress response transcriptional regulator